MPWPLTSVNLSNLGKILIKTVLGIEIILGRQMSLCIQTEQIKRFI